MVEISIEKKDGENYCEILEIKVEIEDPKENKRIKRILKKFNMRGQDVDIRDDLMKRFSTFLEVKEELIEIYYV